MKRTVGAVEGTGVAERVWGADCTFLERPALRKVPYFVPSWLIPDNDDDDWWPASGGRRNDDAVGCAMVISSSDVGTGAYTVRGARSTPNKGASRRTRIAGKTR